MEFQVYYKGWPHSGLHQITALADDASSAIEDVATLLAETGEKYSKPILAMIVGGKL